MQLPIVEFSAEQQELWNRVGELWALSKGRAERQIRATLHPDYVGWDMNTPLPHEASKLDVQTTAELRRLKELERRYKVLKEEHELLKKAIRFASGRKRTAIASKQRQ